MQQMPRARNPVPIPSYVSNTQIALVLVRSYSGQGFWSDRGNPNRPWRLQEDLATDITNFKYRFQVTAASCVQH